MTTSFYCLVVMMLFPYAANKVLLAIAMQGEGKGYDNRNPREQQARLTGWGKRALAAQNNTFEILPIFAIAVFMAYLTNGDPVKSGYLAIYFVVSRVAYLALYLGDKPSARSVVWMSGLASCVALSLISLWG